MRQSRRIRENKQFTGTIVDVRAVEDCIRATKKYTEGVGTMWKNHPVQGDNIPSRSFTKYYEVYPELDLDKTMPFWDAVFSASDWLWGETPRIDVLFTYDYRKNVADVIIKNGGSGMKQLCETIPGFAEAIEEVVANGQCRKPTQ